MVVQKAMWVSRKLATYKCIFRPDRCVTALTSVENLVSEAVEVTGLS